MWVDRRGKVLKWRVYVPKMVQFQVGRLERATHSFNVYSLNQYLRWFAEVPEELGSRFPRVEVELKVSDGLLLSSPESGEATWEKYRRFLLRKEGPWGAQG